MSDWLIPNSLARMPCSSVFCCLIRAISLFEVCNIASLIPVISAPPATAVFPPTVPAISGTPFSPAISKLYFFGTYPPLSKVGILPRSMCVPPNNSLPAILIGGISNDNFSFSHVANLFHISFRPSTVACHALLTPSFMLSHVSRKLSFTLFSFILISSPHAPIAAPNCPSAKRPFISLNFSLKGFMKLSCD